MVENDIVTDVNIGKYIEEQYIFLKAENFNKFGSDNAANVFNQRYLEEQQRIGEEMLQGDIAANQQMASIVKNLGAAETAEDIYNSAAEGNLLELCLEDVAVAINAAMDSVAMQNIQDIVEKAYKNFSTLLEKGNLEKIQDFFDLIEKGLTQLQGGVSNSFKAELTQMKSNFEKAKKGGERAEISIIGYEDLSNAEFLIRKYLFAAAKNLNMSKDIDNKKVAANAFRGTLSNIFNTAICERISQKLFADAIQKALTEEGGIQDTLLNHRFNSKNGVTITAEISERKPTDSNDISNLGTGLGQAVSESGHKSKVDLTGPGILRITIQEENCSTTIEMELNASAKQVLTSKSKLNPQNLKGNIHIVSSNLGTILTAAKSNEISYYSYNTLVHRNSSAWRGGAEAYRSFRNFVAASFFVRWLIGTGEQLQVNGANIGVTDTAQFFLINNKLYSMATVIRSICKKIVDEKVKNPPISIEIRNKAVNKKIGGVDADPNIKDAKDRSRALREALNTVAIGASLNKSIINQYVPNIPSIT